MIQKNRHKRYILENFMLVRSIVEFRICTARRKKRGKHIGDSELTIDWVDTIPRLFLHSYRNSKGRGRTIYQ